ncbi:MAG: FHA domain-containing protein [Bradymonadales bacterium]|nr:FHA domain-containing protein [Bradymonadales bacterium]
MITCKKCGRENEDHFNFCLSCGANLRLQRVAAGEEEERTCPQCHSPVPLSHAFCGQCGARLGGKPAPVSPQTVTPDEDLTPAEPVVSPLSTRSKLVLIQPDGSLGESLGLANGRNVFGRLHGPGAFREDPFLSPEHVAFDLEEDSLVVTDLDSLNGIFVRIVEPTPLVHLDRLRIGRQLLEFQVIPAEPEDLSAEEQEPRALGAPLGDAWGRLVRTSSPSSSVQAFLLTHTEEVIGRERGSILFRDDGFVSSRHARITCSSGGFIVEDLRSSNGTFLKIRGRYNASDGDLFLIGQQPLRVYLAT